VAGKGELDALGIQALAEGPPLLEEFAFFHADLLKYTQKRLFKPLLRRPMRA
jgi:hypothetical protein